MEDFYSQEGAGTRKLPRQKLGLVIARLISFKGWQRSSDRLSN